MLLLRHFQAGHDFLLKHLINQAVVQSHGEDEFTDSNILVLIFLFVLSGTCSNLNLKNLA